MDDLELEAERIEEALEDQTPFGKKEGYAYAGVARKFFGKIKALRNRKYSFIQICRALEKAGLLAAGSNPYGLRQAFCREAVRRSRTNELFREVREGFTEEPEAESPAKRASGIVEPETTARAPSPAASPTAPERKSTSAVGAGAAPASEEAERERIRRMTSRVVDTGTGKIIKRTNGTFDYD